MIKGRNTQIAGGCNPVFSIAGVMPCASNMAWKTAYPNPDASIATPQPASHGPSFSIAGVMPGTADTGWRTAMVDPTRDTLDSAGHYISIAEAQDRARLAAPARMPALEAYAARAVRPAA